MATSLRGVESSYPLGENGRLDGKTRGTVNAQPRRKTVGDQSHRYRLRWVEGITAAVQRSTSIAEPYSETSYGTRRCGLRGKLCCRIVDLV